MLIRTPPAVDGFEETGVGDSGDFRLRMRILEEQLRKLLLRFVVAGQGADERLYRRIFPSGRKQEARVGRLVDFRTCGSAGIVETQVFRRDVLLVQVRYGRHVTVVGDFRFTSGTSAVGTSGS